MVYGTSGSAGFADGRSLQLGSRDKSEGQIRDDAA